MTAPIFQTIDDSTADRMIRAARARRYGRPTFGELVMRTMNAHSAHTFGGVRGSAQSEKVAPPITNAGPVGSGVTPGADLAGE
jgi:hypothetical protein